ncbi:hypothetical protein B0I08_103271 [Glaciihabitans tibetensis]|uniref:DoxX-like protein n=1 Tax=Glaciihabitans tibetensis TaxID=1266600 RepID=A0A2T0VFU5_9MICO|nr:hypothetical protein [Glaciihabitans tibetensis]PRY69065.1 hypothetical protein B0I08_103271 [Glaciihabitans tibetensis]
MPTIVAFVACVLLLGLVGLQIALLAGVPLGRFAWGGRDDVLPTEKRSNAILAIVLYLFFALVILQGVAVVEPFSLLVGQIAIWLLTAYFFVAFIFSAMSTSRHEQILMSIVNVVLAALTLIVAIAGRATL